MSWHKRINPMEAIEEVQVRIGYLQGDRKQKSSI